MTTHDNKSDRVPDLLLEQYRLGELSKDASLRLERRLQEDADLRGRLEALERSDEEIRRRYPPEWLAAQIRVRSGSVEPPPGRSARAAWRRWAIPAAVGAAVLVAIVLMPLNDPLAPDATERLKGSGPRLAFYRRTAEGSEPLADGSLVRRGDLVRIGYQAANRAYGVILSVDGRGAVTRHLPIQGPTAAPLSRDGLVLLDDAYELDDAPRWEAFYFVTSDGPFEVECVLAAARAAASRGAGASPPSIELRPDFSQAMFVLKKEDTP